MPEDISRLNADVARLRKAVTRKVSRLKQRHDVYVSGTSFDPRVPPSTLKNYTPSQLRAHRNELGAFLDRSNQFVPDSQRRPIPASDWKRYKRLESQFNEKVHDFFDRVRDIRTLSGETIGERMAARTPDHRQMGNPAVNAPYEPVERRSIAVSSRAALEKLIAQKEEQIKPGWFERHNREGMEQFTKMLDVLNNQKLENAVKGLTSEQFSVLWNYEGFATSISIQYEIALKMLSDKELPWHSDLAEQALRRANELVKWASNLPLGR